LENYGKMGADDTTQPLLKNGGAEELRGKKNRVGSWSWTFLRLARQSWKNPRGLTLCFW